ncbi:DUF7424 family protein [Veronia pacifica]|uniref:DUF7424 domain-containing protein n=1 Tax=Veronia pacifica TaxID=1080227 RepID=A0A1C3EL60_9GAMM|nr:hypothetical protein [Veronia pacifica]ODA33969.1 hypothetical protein A8L45_07935 [Veronia pacifica]
MKRILFWALPIFLVGCKAEIEMPLKLSDFDKKEKSVQIVGTMAMEVTSCTERGTDMPSDDIFKLQKKIPYVFKGAEYVECKKDGFNSYALFKLPANIDNVKDGKSADDQVINLAFFSNESGGRNLSVYIPPKLRGSINKLIESNVYINASDIVMSLVVDPEGKPMSFTVVGAYLDSKPVQMGSYDTNGGKFKITIPAYGLEQMLQPKNHMFTALMYASFKK